MALEARGEGARRLDLLCWRVDNRIETVHEFEAVPADPFDGVPTSIAEHKGKIYVGQLSSLNPGQAKITVLTKEGKVLRTYTGLSSVTGVAVARNGERIKYFRTA